MVRAPTRELTPGSGMHQVLFGSALLTAFLGGVVALLAPCCVSVMLPAYFATGFSRRTGIAAATGVFAAGVATLIVPIGLGASAISAALPAHHLLIFSIGGTLMLAGGAAVLAGWKPMLPMPSLRSPSGHGYAAAYGLGLFSGIASACCAPVLAGVVVLIRRLAVHRPEPLSGLAGPDRGQLVGIPAPPQLAHRP